MNRKCGSSGYFVLVLCALAPNAGVARNPVDSFFVARCFVHTLGTFFIPKGLHIKAQGCGTPLPWVGGQQYLYPTLKGLCNAGVRKRVRRRLFSLHLPVVAMGSFPHIYRREGHSPGDPCDVAPDWGKLLTMLCQKRFALYVFLLTSPDRVYTRSTCI